MALAAAVLLSGCQPARPGEAESGVAGSVSASPSGAVPPSSPTTVTPSPTGGATARPAESATEMSVQPVVHTPTRAEVASSWRKGCPVAHTSLRVIEANYYGFDEQLHRGSIVVNAAIVDDTVALLQATIDARFPIRSLRPVDDFQGSDAVSMAADNSSAFNCRAVTGGTSWSRHAYGTAVDLNPVENPYIKGGVQPDAGAAYLDRSDVRPGMLVTSSPVVTFALAHGWTWLSSFDYQHFER